MSQTATPASVEEMDRIKLPLTFDITKIKADIEALQLKPYNYYDAMPLRAPAHIVDPSLPLPPPATDYADGSWTDWSDTPALLSSPYLQEMVDMFRQHTKVTLVRILRLGPGSVIQEHTDPTLGLQIDKSVIRLTVPVINEEGVIFYLNDTPVEMGAGECWYMRLTDPHKVVNGSVADRVNISIDMIPNEWVRSMIEEAAANA